MTDPEDAPPATVMFSLDEALLLLAALEDAAAVLNRLVQREDVRMLDIVGPLSAVEYQMGELASRLWPQGGLPNAG
jgi:hypothetical protein